MPDATATMVAQRRLCRSWPLELAGKIQRDIVPSQNNRSAVGRGCLWCDAHVANADDSHQWAVGELHDDHA